MGKESESESESVVVMFQSANKTKWTKPAVQVEIAHMNRKQEIQVIAIEQDSNGGINACKSGQKHKVGSKQVK